MNKNNLEKAKKCWCYLRSTCMEKMLVTAMAITVSLHFSIKAEQILNIHDTKALLSNLSMDSTNNIKFIPFGLNSMGNKI